MTPPERDAQGPVRPGVALALCTVGFFALLIAGLGVVSLATSADVIETEGLGPVPGVLGTSLAVAVFAVALGAVLRGERRSFVSILWIAAAVLLAYLAGIWIGAVSTDIAAATAVVGRIATSWFGVVVVAAALVAAWSGIALVRTRAARPRWPWEDEDE